jgi:hypothetical protein
MMIDLSKAKIGDKFKSNDGSLWTFKGVNWLLWDEDAYVLAREDHIRESFYVDGTYARAFPDHDWTPISKEKTMDTMEEKVITQEMVDGYLKTRPQCSLLRDTLQKFVGLPAEHDAVRNTLVGMIKIECVNGEDQFRFHDYTKKFKEGLIRTMLERAGFDVGISLTLREVFEGAIKTLLAHAPKPIPELRGFTTEGRRDEGFVQLWVEETHNDSVTVKGKFPDSDAVYWLAVFELDSCGNPTVRRSAYVEPSVLDGKKKGPDGRILLHPRDPASKWEHLNLPL